ncbi:FecR family protein [Pedobacter sp. ok626]|uniref:FecR family protein n=1 Tax=Pedobacter sp. ok626 TaxID=1761882 RepID=UPI00087F654B|nr:FecR family protein [Pedobacter sp. ok626]SDK25745.1 FecR family protein [Pedobacter sp. ok626]
MENKEAKELLIKYKVGICTDEELAMLESWYLNFEDEATNLIPEDVIGAKAKVWMELPVHSRMGKAVRLWPRIAIAASVAICMAVGLIYYQSAKDQTVNDLSGLATIVPGGNKAMLTLADGSKIDLSNVSKGTFANQSGITITKAADGQLIYTVVESKGEEKMQFNTIETPRGGYYQILLPDGSKVWLNAASSLRYPANLTAMNERRVELKGEAYFEVKKANHKPFIVATDKQEVEVLGTHFNVKSYADDNSTKTTLLEGSVQVIPKSSGISGVILKPGLQAELKSNGLKVLTVEVEDEIDWKNGDFVFKEERLESIMRKIARWYDVQVIYRDDVPKNVTLEGLVSRAKSISEVLSLIESTGKVHFTIEGRRIVVTK